ncbi:hypothetical protein [Cohnella sp.]|uniref:hypothetical protein n=1 Tax=Cohnella sp. TaxID=1883426 RepID=UPI003561E4AF
MKTNEFDKLQKISNEQSAEEWEERLRLTPEEIAKREAAAQVEVERERHRLRLEELAAQRQAEAAKEEEARKQVEKEKKARKRRLASEVKRLRESYNDLPPDLMRVAEGLIQRAAFMRLTLEDYERDIEDNGSVEMFQQSPNVPPMQRKRPVAELYNTMNKNYQSITKQLADLVPPAPPVPKAPPPKDPFEQLLDRGREGNGG